MFKGYEFISCPMCERDETELMFTSNVQPHQKGQFSFDEWKIVRCKHCGLVYVNPRITETVNQEYYKFKLDGDQAFINNHFIASAAYHASYWQRMVRVVKKYKKAGKLLDVGCGSGDFLIAAKAAGFCVIGQDISDYFVELNKTENQITVGTSFYLKPDESSNSFDVITCFDVIEHHRNPVGLLSEIRKLLKPGGLLIISTHDIGNIFAKLYGEKWRMIYPIGHLTYFTRKTMRKILSQSGYDLIRITGANNIDDDKIKEILNGILSLFKTIFIRTIILFIYKPFMNLFPVLKGWKIRFRGTTYTHELITFIAGNQIIFNDEFIAISKLSH